MCCETVKETAFNYIYLIECPLHCDAAISARLECQPFNGGKNHPWCFICGPHHASIHCLVPTAAALTTEHNILRHLINYLRIMNAFYAIGEIW